MPYKLGIGIKIKHPKKYRKLLDKKELIIGYANSFVLEIENIGTKRFPGGTVVAGTVKIDQGLGMRTLTSTYPVSPEIPKIKPNKTTEIEFPLTVRLTPGVAEFSLKVKPSDDEPIKYYPHKDEPGKSEFKTVLYAVDRHKLEIILLLQKLVKKGE